MTGLIVIGESGDLGSQGSTYFAIAALVILRPRHLKVASKLLPNDGREHKWINTDPDDHRDVVIDKNDPDSANVCMGASSAR